MARTRKVTVSTVLTTVLAAAVMLAPTAAAADKPTSRTLRDGIQTGAHYDIRKVVLRAAPLGGLATVATTFAADVLPGDRFVIWFNTDRDSKPEMVLSAIAYSEYSLVAWGTRRELNCVDASLSENKAIIKVNPACVGPSKAMTVAVRAANGSGAGADRVGSRRDWPARIASYR